MTKHLVINLLLIGTALILFILELILGSVHIPFQDVIDILFNQGEYEKLSWEVIVMESRFPRAVSAILAGVFLSVSGLLMQTLFRNPLAGPHILGISAGSSLGVALVIMGLNVFGISMGFFSEKLIVVLASLAGAFLVLGFLFLVSLRVRDVMTVLVFGILISAVSLALVGILQYFGPESQLKSFLIWTLGSFDGVVTSEAWTMLLLGLPFLLLVLFLIKPLNMLLSGEEMAQSLGLKLRRSRILIMLSAGGLTALITAFCGPIGFIGVVVPHFSRMIYNAYDHKTLIIGSILIGVNVVLFADLIAHLPGSDALLPVNSVTSLIGIPFLFWMLLKRKMIVPV